MTQTVKQWAEEKAQEIFEFAPDPGSDSWHMRAAITHAILAAAEHWGKRGFEAAQDFSIETMESAYKNPNDWWESVKGEEK